MILSICAKKENANSELELNDKFDILAHVSDKSWGEVNGEHLLHEWIIFSLECPPWSLREISQGSTRGERVDRRGQRIMSWGSEVH